MRIRSVWTAAALIALAGGVASGAGQVQVDLIGEGQGTAMAFQQWMQTLSQAGIRNVRIRSAESAGKVGIEVRGEGESQIYVVTGVVRSADELLMPSGRFRRGDVARLATWLDELARLGPEDQREPLAAFGLTREQLAEVLKDLSAPVGLATQELTRDEAAAKIGRRLSLPLRIDPSQSRKLAASKVGDDLSALSCGTALAYLLQPVGLGLVPRASDGGIVYVLVEIQPGPRSGRSAGRRRSRGPSCCRSTTSSATSTSRTSRRPRHWRRSPGV